LHGPGGRRVERGGKWIPQKRERRRDGLKRSELRVGGEREWKGNR